MLIESSIAAAAAAAGLVFYTQKIETRWLRIREIDLQLRGAMPPFEILHISDLHYYKGHTHSVPFIQRLGEREVDFIFITGDIIDDDNGIDTAIEALKPLRARYGIYAVFGNHDYYRISRWDMFRKTGALPRSPRSKLNDVDRLIRSLDEIGIRVLQNERVDLQFNGTPLSIVGIDDPYVFRDDLSAAFLDYERKGTLFVLVHSPERHTELAKLQPDLVLAGHTHGGQVCLPFIGPIVTRSTAPRRYVKGLLHENGTVFYTSNGAGTGRVAHPRFWCRPEVTYFHLTFIPA